MSFVDPSRNPLHDPASGLYHGDVPTDPSVGATLRVADEPPAGDEPYEDLTVEQLRPIARDRGIPYADLKKSELIEALYEYDDEHADA